MRSVVQPRIFFEALITRKKIPLIEVLKFFTKKNGNSDLEWASQFIYSIHQGGALILEDAAGQQRPFSSELLSEADKYILVLKDIGVLDSYTSSGYLALADLNFPVEDTPPEHHCALQFHALFRVVGEKEGAEREAEKIRAFTHFFAYQLATKDLDKAAHFFSSLIGDKNTAPLLLAKLESVESIYGEISYFDQVSLDTVYYGKGRNKKLFREMSLPKGVDRDMRRGESEFYLVGMHTPSGSMLNAVRVALGVIEEEGVLKIANIDWHME